MSGQVRLSDASKDTLERVKEEHDHTSIDSAFREIAMRADVVVVPDEKLEVDGEEQDDGDGWSSEWDSIASEER